MLLMPKNYMGTPSTFFGACVTFVVSNIAPTSYILSNYVLSCSISISIVIGVGSNAFI
jgi:hypothetical protein